MFNVELNNGATLRLPQSIREITEDYLKEVSNEINVAPNYSLIGLVYKEKLSTILNASKSNKNIATKVTPVFVKRDANESNEFIKNINIGDIMIVAPSDIEIGNHVTLPRNSYSIGRVTSTILKETTIAKKVFEYTEVVCFLEFKIIPNCVIRAKIAKPNGTTQEEDNGEVN